MLRSTKNFSLLCKIYICYSWVMHHFHFPEIHSKPISQSTSLSSKLTPWFALSGTEGKCQDMSDKLRDEATTVNLQQGWRKSLCRAAGRCWRLTLTLGKDAGVSKLRLLWAFCFVFTGSLPVSIMQKKIIIKKIKEKKEKFPLPSKYHKARSFTGILEI